MAQAPKKREALPMLISPSGVASFAHLSKPDTEGKYADGKYKVKLKLAKAGRPDQEKVDAFIEHLNELHATARGKKKTDSPVHDGDDKEYEGDHGYWLINFKSKYQPDMRDSKKNKLPKDVEVKGGDIIRVAFVALPYEEGKNAGISTQLQAVMLIEKRVGGAGNGGDAFEEEEEGYVADAADESEDDDAPAGDDDGDGADY